MGPKGGRAPVAVDVACTAGWWRGSPTDRVEVAVSLVAMVNWPADRPGIGPAMKSPK